MPSVKFSLPSSDYLRGMNSMKFVAETTENGILQPNCEICMSPGGNAGLLVLEVQLTDSVGGGGTDFDIVLSITNNTGQDVTASVSPGDFTWDGPVALTWNTLTELITNGSTGTAINASSDGNLIGVGVTVTVEGFVSAQNAALTETWYSNTDSDSFTG